MDLEQVGDELFVHRKHSCLLEKVGLCQIQMFFPNMCAVIEEFTVLVEDPDGEQCSALEVEIDRFHDGFTPRAVMDGVDLRKLGNDAKIFVHMINERFNVLCDFPGEQKLLLVELPCHLFLERLMKELSENDNQGKHKEKCQDKGRRREQLFLFKELNYPLKHGIMYF